jgi:colicin import membrane protein
MGLSLLVHGALLALLLFGMRWQAPQVQTVAAELWASVPQAATPQATPPTPAEPTEPVTPPREPAPPPPAPPARPTPQPEADIALQQAKREREKKEQAERDRLARQQAADERAAKERAERDKAAREKTQRERVAKEKAAQEQAAKEKLAQEKAAQAKAAEEKARKDKAERERLAKAQAEAERKQREENLARMMGQLGGAGAPTGSAARSGGATGGAAAGGASGGPSANYAGRLVAAIKPNIVFADDVPGNPAAVVEVRVGPGGTVIGRSLVRSSGHPEWDEAVLRAIDRTGTLPKDTDGRVPPKLQITFRVRD